MCTRGNNVTQRNNRVQAAMSPKSYNRVSLPQTHLPNRMRINDNMGFFFSFALTTCHI